MLKQLLIVSFLGALTCTSAFAATSTSPTAPATAPAPAPAAAPAPAPAATPTLPKIRDLLGQGFEIKGLTVIPQEIAQHMAGNTSWTDDLMITLEHGSELAFCHVALKSTLYQGTDFLGYTCYLEQ